MVFNRSWFPNSLTIGSLLCGFAAIVLAAEGKNIYPGALWLLFIASWLDIFDGGLARIMHIDSPFGRQLDALSDVVTFAIAPALLMLVYSLHLAGWMGFLASAAFVCCGVGRLARYTTQVAQAKRAHFVGMPIGISGIFAGLIVVYLGTSHALLAAILVFGISLLMISTIPFPTPGQIAFQTPIPVRLVLAGIWIFGMLRLETWLLMPLSYFIYGVLQNLVVRLRPATMQQPLEVGGE